MISEPTYLYCKMGYPDIDGTVFSPDIVRRYPDMALAAAHAAHILSASDALKEWDRIGYRPGCGFDMWCVAETVDTGYHLVVSGRTRPDQPVLGRGWYGTNNRLGSIREILGAPALDAATLALDPATLVAFLRAQEAVGAL
jgi:hypothetical protein